MLTLQLFSFGNGYAFYLLIVFVVDTVFIFGIDVGRVCFGKVLIERVGYMFRISRVLRRFLLLLLHGRE
jgi:K+-transporting ATPase A subunit